MVVDTQKMHVLVITVVIGLAFALLIVAVALIVLVTLILAAVFALLFGPAWGYVRLVLACTCQELGWGRWKETSSS